VAVRGLRAGEFVPTPQPAGPAKGVVSLEAGKRPHRDEKDQQQLGFSKRKLTQNQKINCARVVDAKSRTCAGVP
jgi:hypothetical protein